MKQQRILFSVAAVAIAGTILAILLIYSRTKNEAQKQPTDSRIESLLNQSSTLLGSSIEMATQKANQALALSKMANNQHYTIRAIELLAEVKYIVGDPNEALRLYAQAYEMATKGDFQYEICKIEIETGKIFYNWGKYDIAQDYFNRALELALKNHEKRLTSQALFYIGKYFRIKGDFSQAMSFFQKALQMAHQTNDYKQIAITLNTEGKYYIGDGNLIAALQCYQDALDASEKTNDKLLIATTCNHLGGLYLLTDQYEKALEYHRKALSYRDIMNNPEGMAKSYNNIGKAYLELHNTDSAQHYFSKSFELCNQTGYKKGLVKALTNLGRIYMLKGDVKKSEEQLSKAFNIATQSGYSLGIAESSQALGNLHKATGEIDKALSDFNWSQTHLNKLDFEELNRINYQGLYECYKVKGDYKKALEFHQLLLETDKKLLNVENNRQLATLQITYNSERKDKANEVLRKDNELKEMTIRRKTTLLWLIAALLFSTVLLCLYIYNRFYSKIKANLKLKVLNSKVIVQNKALEKLNQELNEANEEKDKLFSIIAHELRNPLYWFQNLAEVLSKNHQTMKPEKIQKSLLALDESAKNAFHLMDNLLHWSRSRLNRITTNKENHHLETLVGESLKMYQTIMLYKEIELRISLNATAHIYADADLFSCIVRNLVSNAIKYTPTKGVIDIKCLDGTDFITILVSDTGIGIALDNMEDVFNSEIYNSNLGLMQEKGSGLGLKICKEFVELNGGTIWVTKNQERGTRFLFTVPKADKIETAAQTLALPNGRTQQNSAEKPFEIIEP